MSHAFVSGRGVSMRVLTRLLALALCSATTGPIFAINIVPIYNAGASVEPGQDPTGGLLTDLFDYAEVYYQDILEDSFTLTINFWWEDLDPIGTGVLGVHNRVTESGGYNIESNIRLDNDRTWFIDSTPEDDSEFNMAQILWRDLTPTEQSDYFSNFGAAIPETFEVGYRGEADAGGPADGVYDLLSTVLHEIGHSLGLTGATNTDTETNDGDYDFTPAFVFGQTLAAEHETGDRYHLDDPFSMMCGGCGGVSLRRRPSHTDFFSMASANDFVDLDVPRREFYGGSDWNSAGNWSGNTIPGSADEVYVRDPGAIVTANLSAAGFAANLFVSEGGNVDTEGFKLDVADRVTISDVDSDIFVQTGGELEATRIVVQNDAELNVNGGLVDADTITLTQGTTATYMQGTAGTIDVQSTLNNNATIRALSGGALTFTSTGGAVWDLDGSLGDGVVQAILGNLTFASGSVTDAFDGDIDVGDGSSARTLRIAEPWSLGSVGIVDMAGGVAAADRASISGGELTATAGDINANSGINRIESAVVLGGSVDVVVGNGATLEFTGTISNGGGDYTANGTGQLEFVGTTTYTGGTLNVAGIIQQNGDANVTGDTTINGERFDLDGDSGAGVDWTIGNADLVLNVDSIESAGSGGFFDGTITVNSGLIGSPASLTINVSGGNEWTMAGTLNSNGTADPFIVQTIGAGTAFNLTGTANVSGNSSWAARVDLSGTINTANAAATIRLTGGTLADPNRLIGGTIAGLGTLSATTNDALVGAGTINTAVNFLNDAELLADDGTMTVNGAINDVGTIGTADADGVLNVTNAWNTSVANQLELRGGSVIGATITNGGITTGFGQITAAGFINSNVTSAMGGTLILNSVAFPDLDGATETGTVNAVDGNLDVPGNFGGAYVFDGTLNVGPGRAFNMLNTGLVNRGLVNLAAGTVAAASFRHEDTLLVNPGLSAISELGGGILFAAGGNATLNGDLNLIGNSLIQAGANFAGPRRLFVAVGGNLRIANGAVVGVGIANNGRTEVGASPGIALVNSFAQSAVGTYEAEIDGLLVGTQYDQLQVTGSANLAGTMDILINQNGGAYADPAAPGSFDAFTLLSAGSVAGDFDAVFHAGAELVPEFGVGAGGDFVALASCGLFRVMDYSNTDVQLINYRALPGDANGDGSVDGLDFIIWNSNKFTVGTDWTTGDFTCDGVTDGSDFIAWNSHKFTNVVLPLRAGGLAINLVPEPDAGVLIVLALLPLVRTRFGARHTVLAVRG